MPSGPSSRGKRGLPLLAAPFHLGQLRGRAAQCARHVECIPGASAAAPQRAPRWGRSHQHNVCQHQPAGRFAGVAARQRYCELLGQTTQTGEKPLDPAASSGGCQHFAGQRQREKCGERASAHSGQVAKAARQRPVAHRLRRMPVAPKVASLQREVGRNQYLVPFRRAQDGAIVANAERQVPRAAMPKRPSARTPPGADAFDQRQFPHSFLHREAKHKPGYRRSGIPTGPGAWLKAKIWRIGPIRHPETLCNPYNLSVDSCGKWIALTLGGC